MNEWELTENEINDELLMCASIGGASEYRYIARAAQKKLVEWLEKNTPVAQDFNGELLWHELRGADWQGLKEGVK
jgi:hypothetical protein